MVQLQNSGKNIVIYTFICRGKYYFVLLLGCLCSGNILLVFKGGKTEVFSNFMETFC